MRAEQWWSGVLHASFEWMSAGFQGLNLMVSSKHKHLLGWTRTFRIPVLINKWEKLLQRVPRRITDHPSRSLGVSLVRFLFLILTAHCVLHPDWLRSRDVSLQGLNVWCPAGFSQSRPHLVQVHGANEKLQWQAESDSCQPPLCRVSCTERGQFAQTVSIYNFILL